MKNSSGSEERGRKAPRQQAASQVRGSEFKPLQLPALKAAMHAVKPAARKPAQRKLPSFLQGDHSSD
jgi:hypothetical protein